MTTRPAYARLRRWRQAHPEWRAGDYSYEESILEDLSTANPQEYITRVAVLLQQSDDKRGDR